MRWKAFLIGIVSRWLEMLKLKFICYIATNNIIIITATEAAHMTDGTNTANRKVKLRENVVVSRQ